MVSIKIQKITTRIEPKQVILESPFRSMVFSFCEKKSTTLVVVNTLLKAQQRTGPKKGLDRKRPKIKIDQEKGISAPSWGHIRPAVMPS